MSTIIDRRKNGKNKSLGNRRRFLKRAKKTIKEQIDKVIDKNNIGDIKDSEKITIPNKGISEPTFNNGKGGNKKYILPGNKDKEVGDQIKKPPQGSGGSGNEGSPDGEGEDDFTFTLSKDEFLDFFFEDLELPDLVKTQLKDVESYKIKRTGFTTVGNPSSLSVIRTMKSAIGRRIALQSPYQKELKELHKKIETECMKCKYPDCYYKEDWQAGYSKCGTVEKITEVQKKIDNVPFIDEFDLRYNAFEKKPDPSTKAVMFCIMDVSASMGDYEKTLAKKFFTLLHLFLTTKYDKIDLVFIRHHSASKEVDEQEFFYSKESGGTIVSTALELASDIITKRYPTSDWNIYFAQASDGDNWSGDSQKCVKHIQEKIMPFVQYYAYVQVDHEVNAMYNSTGYIGELWKHFEGFASEHDNFVMKEIKEPTDIFPVFKELFRKER